MRDENEAEIHAEAEASDRYGDVALGVECAWPQTLPAVQAPLSDTVDMRFAT